MEKKYISSILALALGCSALPAFANEDSEKRCVESSVFTQIGIGAAFNSLTTNKQRTINIPATDIDNKTNIDFYSKNTKSGSGIAGNFVAGYQFRPQASNLLLGFLLGIGLDNAKTKTTYTKNPTTQITPVVANGVIVGRNINMQSGNENIIMTAKDKLNFVMGLKLGYVVGSSFVPYVQIGYVPHKLSFSMPGVKSVNKWFNCASFAIGTDFYVSRNLALGLEYRYDFSGRKSIDFSKSFTSTNYQSALNPSVKFKSSTVMATFKYLFPVAR